MLFDLGGVIIDISFEKVLERWSHYLGTNPDTLESLFKPDLS